MIVYGITPVLQQTCAHCRWLKHTPLAYHCRLDFITRRYFFSARFFPLDVELFSDSMNVRLRPSVITPPRHRIRVLWFLPKSVERPPYTLLVNKRIFLIIIGPFEFIFSHQPSWYHHHITVPCAHHWQSRYYLKGKSFRNIRIITIESNELYRFLPDQSVLCGMSGRYRPRHSWALRTFPTSLSQTFWTQMNCNEPKWREVVEPDMS